MLLRKTFCLSILDISQNILEKALEVESLITQKPYYTVMSHTNFFYFQSTYSRKLSQTVNYDKHRRSLWFFLEDLCI